jgi:hypothetical protein
LFAPNQRGVAGGFAPSRARREHGRREILVVRSRQRESEVTGFTLDAARDKLAAMRRPTGSLRTARRSTSAPIRSDGCFDFVFDFVGTRQLCGVFSGSRSLIRFDSVEPAIS